MRRHGESHIKGKMSSMFKNMINTKKQRHPVLMEVMRALFNHDSVTGSAQGRYASRAKSCLSKWMSSSTPSSTQTLFTRMGKGDKHMVFVLTEDGPEFWRRDDLRLKNSRPFGKHFYTMGFANAFARRLFETGGKVAPAMRLMRTTWLGRGCVVTCLANRQFQMMCAMVIDILESTTLKKYMQQMRLDLARKGEFRAISADATYKLSLKVDGQTRLQQHNYVTLIGFHGCPLAIEPAHGESTEILKKIMGETVPPTCRKLVEQTSFDKTSAKLHASLRTLLPKLLGCSLDTSHLPMAVDRHTSKRRIKPTLVGLVVRAIMRKFNIAAKSRKDEALYSGRQALLTTDVEKKLMNSIVAGDMPKPEAMKILKTMNPNVAMKSREEFVRLIAALVVIYPQRLDVKTDKTTLRKILAAACQPERTEWYFNNIRYRSRLTDADDKFLGNGTCRNEQLHATLNTQYRGIVNITSRMLNAQLRVWLAAEMAVFIRAMETSTTVNIKRVNLRPMVVSGIELFSRQDWALLLRTPKTIWVSGTKQQKNPDKLRRGPQPEQEEVYKAISEKIVKRKRHTVYTSLLQKRLRSK
jgi:hypothetical protein